MQDDKKTPSDVTETPLTPEESHKIEVKVDKMLDPKAPNPKPVAVSPPADETLPPIDIFSDTKTAPEVPAEVMKTMVEPTDTPEVTAAPDQIKNSEPEPETDGTEPLAAETEEPVNQALADDPTTAAAVDDITAHESDEVLAAQDAELAKAFDPNRPNWHQKLKGWLSAWWHNKKARYGTLIGLVLLIVVLAIVPTTRAFALNAVGMRANATVTVLDNTTQLPLKNVAVSLGGASGTTDQNGKTLLQHVKLGQQKLNIQRVAFAPIHKAVNVTFGTNSFGNVALTAVGAQYKFAVVDYVSGKPVTTAQAASGDATAEANNKGVIVLTVKDPSSSTLPVSITADGYRTTAVKVTIGSSATTNVQLLTTRPEVYVSKQSGKYDVYKATVDGQNKQLLLAGTGNENDQLTLIASPDSSEAALVSTRDNMRDSGGYLLQALTLINIKTGTPTTIDHSEKIQLVDWIGTRLIYVEVKAGASAGNPSRYLLMSYDYSTGQRWQLDHANYFNDVVSAGGVIYYATSNQYAGGVSQFAKINPDNTGKQTLLNNEVWNIFRTDYSNFALSSATSWYTYKLGDTKPATTPNAYNGTSRLYQDSPDGKHSAWVDTRDGKGALIIYDKSTQKETVLVEQSGLTYPIRWLTNSTIVYRIKTSQETADYVIDLQSTAGKKVTDVTNADGLTLWYYY